MRRYQGLGRSSYQTYTLNPREENGTLNKTHTHLCEISRRLFPPASIRYDKFTGLIGTYPTETRLESTRIIPAPTPVLRTTAVVIHLSPTFHGTPRSILEVTI